jgi:hypothetical protein
MSPTATVEKFPGWETLSQEDTGAILDIIKKGTASKGNEACRSVFFFFLYIT